MITHSGAYRPPKRQELFLKGPVPKWWLQEAGRLGKAALAVGLELWFQNGLTKRNPVKLSNQMIVNWGLTRHSKYRALKQLELAGLVRVRNQGNQSPEVLIIMDRDAPRESQRDE
jgi:hypothetical protein